MKVTSRTALLATQARGAVRRSAVAAASLLLLLAGCGQARPEAPDVLAPDLILFNGKIVTVNADFDVEQAVALRGDKILAVGADEAVMALSGAGTAHLDLRGKTVIPGLIDNHHHLLKKATDQHLGVEVALVDSIAEMVRRIGQKVDQTQPGELVFTTSGWLLEQLEEKRTPTRHDLDPVSPDNPVIVQGGHAYFLNSHALEQAGITRDTVAPQGGIIEKDPETGEPTGGLLENAMNLAKNVVSAGESIRWSPGIATHEERLEALRIAQEKLNSAGVTGVREPGIGPAEMRVYQELRDAGELTLRVSMNLHLDHYEPTAALIQTLENWGVSTGFGDAMLRLDGIGEFGIDGGFEAALMSEPFVHLSGQPAPADYRGLQRIPIDKFQAVMRAMNRLGWRASVHVVGDRGMDIVLDAYEAANREQPIARKRWLVEHAHYTRPDQFERMKALDVTISTQFHPYMAAQNMIYYWGEERAANSMRVRDWLDAGLRVGGGSDWSLVPADPFWMIYFFVTRDTRLGGVIGPEQAITREEALCLMTINNAYITFEEDIKGSLEPGKLADMVILSEDILTVPEERIRDISPLATLLGGRVVFQQADFDFPAATRDE